MMILGEHRPGQIDLSPLFAYFGYVNILFVVLILLLLHLSSTTGGGNRKLATDDGEAA
ncbi:MAG: hypothetical protein Q4A34_00190 [Candidatus Saccharibacteria bacterium]|nr:hypothetical protein [Candidatus Saccharibacteria bacterium]